MSDETRAVSDRSRSVALALDVAEPLLARPRASEPK